MSAPRSQDRIRYRPGALPCFLLPGVTAYVVDVSHNGLLLELPLDTPLAALGSRVSGVFEPLHRSPRTVAGTVVWREPGRLGLLLEQPLSASLLADEAEAVRAGIKPRAPAPVAARRPVAGSRRST